jgi:hypothetical protein
VKTWKEKILCDLLRRHNGGDLIGFDGASLMGTCSRCKRPVLQDSQGNWFAIGYRRLEDWEEFKRSTRV